MATWVSSLPQMAQRGWATVVARQGSHGVVGEVWWPLVMVWWPLVVVWWPPSSGACPDAPSGHWLWPGGHQAPPSPLMMFRANQWPLVTPRWPHSGHLATGLLLVATKPWSLSRCTKWPLVVSRWPPSSPAPL